MQHRCFAAFNRIFICFAGQSTPPRAGFQDATIDAGFQSKEHGMHRDEAMIVASMLSASSLRKTRFVSTVTRPPSIST